MLIAASASCERGLFTPSGTEADGKPIDIGLMYWCEFPLLIDGDWRFVVGGTVLNVRAQPENEDTGYAEVTGVVRIERVFLHRPTPHRQYTNQSRVTCGGFDGLKPGDKVILFAHEYEDHFGIPKVSGSNCRVGIKVSDWNEPIVGAIEKWIIAGDDAWDLLDDPAYEATWKPYAAEGIAQIRERQAWLKEEAAAKKP